MKYLINCITGVWYEIKDIKATQTCKEIIYLVLISTYYNQTSQAVLASSADHSLPSLSHTHTRQFTDEPLLMRAEQQQEDLVYSRSRL